MSHQHVRVAVDDTRDSGVELVPAERVDDVTWRLLKSPLYAMGFAAGDLVVVRDGRPAEIVERGGNVCVQFYLSEASSDDAEATQSVARGLKMALEEQNGRVDATTVGLVSCTIPVIRGFASIERLFTAMALSHPGAQWQYANVYHRETGEPLGWWHR